MIELVVKPMGVKTSSDPLGMFAIVSMKMPDGSIQPLMQVRESRKDELESREYPE
jgi:hypothetical protein